MTRLTSVPAERPLFSPSPGSSFPRGAHPYAALHLAFASGELARTVPAPARYRQAEARFRSLADSVSGAGDARSELGPAVLLDESRLVGLADLLIHAWERHGKPFPGRGIEPTMVEAARQLLEELDWRIVD